VIGTLKAPFVQGMLNKDEFDQRVDRTFAAWTYADLATVTADLPAGPAAAQPPQAARAEGEQPVLRPGKLIAVATALYAGVWAFSFLPPWPANSEGDPPAAIIMLFFSTTLIYRWFWSSLWGRRSKSGGRSVPAGSHRGGLARVVRHPGGCLRQARAAGFLQPVTVTVTPPKQHEAFVPVGGRRTSRPPGTKTGAPEGAVGNPVATLAPAKMSLESGYTRTEATACRATGPLIAGSLDSSQPGADRTGCLHRACP
jgi:hypothetical protein